MSCEPANDNRHDKKQAKPEAVVIAIRKTCDATGTGLSHYVLMDKQARQ